MGKEREKSLSPNLEDYQYSHNYAPPARDNSKDYQYSYAPSQMDYSTDYHYSYPNPRDRSMSIVSTMSTRMKQFSASKDYQYSYPGEEEEKGDTDSNENKEADEKEDKQKEESETRDEVEKYFPKEKASLVTLYEKHEEQSAGHISSRFY